MEKGTDSLRADHESVSILLDVMDSLKRSVENGEKPEKEDLIAISGFLTGFNDDYHHIKEENFLFPALEAAGIPKEGGPIGIMLQEHAMGRAAVEEIVKAAGAYNDGDESALEAFIKASEEYVFVLRQHVDKENNILFRMADVHLDQFDQADLIDSFDTFLEEEFGTERYEALLSSLDTLRKKYLP